MSVLGATFGVRDGDVQLHALDVVRLRKGRVLVQRTAVVALAEAVRHDFKFEGVAGGDVVGEAEGVWSGVDAGGQGVGLVGGQLVLWGFVLDVVTSGESLAVDGLLVGHRLNLIHATLILIRATHVIIRAIELTRPQDVLEVVGAGSVADLNAGTTGGVSDGDVEVEVVEFVGFGESGVLVVVVVLSVCGVCRRGMGMLTPSQR